MGELARYLAEQFERHERPGWTARREQPLISSTLAKRLGFAPHVDVLFEGPDGRRVAVEFEVSRADPVANQVKFLIALDAGALHPDDVIVSMVSSHVTRGRRAIAAAFAGHLRALGVSAFQSSLLPFIDPAQIRDLNQSTRATLDRRGVPVRDELERVFSIVEPRGDSEHHRIHFVGDVTDVLANLWAFNDNLRTEEGILWRRRQVQFFVVDPATGLFAPTKFCAFLPALRLGGPTTPPTMTFRIYSSLGEQDSRFDGNVARRHLERRLAFNIVPLDDSHFRGAFEAWHQQTNDQITLRKPVILLLPPDWYRRSP